RGPAPWQRAKGRYGGQSTIPGAIATDPLYLPCSRTCSSPSFLIRTDFDLVEILFLQLSDGLVIAGDGVRVGMQEDHDADACRDLDTRPGHRKRVMKGVEPRDAFEPAQAAEDAGLPDLEPDHDRLPPQRVGLSRLPQKLDRVQKYIHGLVHLAKPGAQAVHEVGLRGAVDARTDFHQSHACIGPHQLEMGGTMAYPQCIERLKGITKELLGDLP